MLANTNVYLQRLVALREFGFPLAEQMRREGRLNFYWYMSECGTEGCLLGWWATTEYAQEDGWHFTIDGIPRWMDSRDAGREYFDINSDTWDALFCGASFGTLADRRARLDALIAERAQ